MKKTKEELLKIYSAYLPYELMFCSNGDKTLKYAWKLRGIKTDLRYPDKPTLLSERDDYSNIINIWSPCAKPILYSMDMLTKEIEHKGGRFIPIERLFDIETNLEWSKSGHIKSEKGKDEYWVRLNIS